VRVVVVQTADGCKIKVVIKTYYGPVFHKRRVAEIEGGIEGYKREANAGNKRFDC